MNILCDSLIVFLQENEMLDEADPLLSYNREF